MILYEFRCPFGEPIEEMFPLGEAPAFVKCPDHNSLARRKVSHGNFVTVPGAHNSEYQDARSRDRGTA